jgi:ferredoxin
VANTIIAEECINCGNCEPECPKGAIRPGDDVYVIDAGLCDDCRAGGSICAGEVACPTEAIVSAA